jgi:hypothetical protein
MSHDHTDFGAQIPFLGYEGLFSPAWPPKVYFFLLHDKFSNDGYVHTDFGLSEPIFAFWT